MKRYSTFAIALAFFTTITIWVSVATSQAPPAAGQQQAVAAAGGQRGGPGSEQGIAIFQTQCMGCHGHPKFPNAPTPVAIREMSPERIHDSLTKGAIKDHGTAMSDVDKRLVAEFMGSRPLGSAKVGDARNMPNQCRNNPAMTDPARGPSWNGWGVDFSNSRFQPAPTAGLTA